MNTDEKIDAMRQDIGEIKEMMARFEAVREQTSELRDTVYGNGRLGLKERMEAQESLCKAKTNCKPPSFLGRVAEQVLGNVLSVIAVAIIAALFWLWVGAQVVAVAAAELKP